MARSKLFKRAAAAALLCSALFTASASAQTAMQERGYTVQQNAVAGAVRELNTNASLTDAITRPRFQVRLVSFHANNETGPDWPGSDEIFAVYETNGYHAATSTYGDIDTGDTQRINPRNNCVYPAVDPDRQRNAQWRCDRNGAPGAIDFSLKLYETDGHTPWAWGACLEGGSTDVLAANQQLVCSNVSTSRVFETSHSLTEAALTTMLPEPGASREYTINGDAYSVTYRITRTTDLVVEQERTLSH
jgi:hypothetical protein